MLLLGPDPVLWVIRESLAECAPRSLLSSLFDFRTVAPLLPYRQWSAEVGPPASRVGGVGGGASLLSRNPEPRTNRLDRSSSHRTIPFPASPPPMPAACMRDGRLWTMPSLTPSSRPRWASSQERRWEGCRSRSGVQLGLPLAGSLSRHRPDRAGSEPCWSRKRPSRSLVFQLVRRDRPTTGPDPRRIARPFSPVQQTAHPGGAWLVGRAAPGESRWLNLGGLGEPTTLAEPARPGVVLL
jgi:hypothetical protein